MTTASRLDPRPRLLAIWLIVAGAIGLAAAFLLTIDKLDMLRDPNAQLTCSFNVLIGCATNLASWQGSLLGFPNPLLGLIGWTATIAAGVAVLASRGGLARWFWIALNAGVVLALALVVFLITASLTVLHILCPWCMVTWAVTIPTFWGVTLYNLKSGTIPVPERARRLFATLYGWVPVLTVASYAVVAVLAQIQLDWIHRAFA
ncbi:vitamin K epoxide reductase family protein [Leifsonia naganoensis]|uniref:Putative membrane protein n=1 Tax=Leifsonia naganoensis TaxID=150025 RepID=A0A853DUD6_9MICO|nr:vitamin K epoxide reductase family protein [Leifsonia naganoensis]NYK09335.1 putative membrane protein [Leifsonia naganoensis]